MTLNYERAASPGELFIDERGLGYAVIFFPPVRRGPVLFFLGCLGAFLLMLAVLLWTSGGPQMSRLAGLFILGVLGCGLAAAAALTSQRKTLDLSPNGFRFRSSIHGAFREEWIVLWSDVREIIVHPIRHVIKIRLAVGPIETRFLDCNGATAEQTTLLGKRLEEARALRMDASAARVPSS